MKVKTFRAENLPDLEKLLNDFYQENKMIHVISNNYQTATYPNMMGTTVVHYVILTYSVPVHIPKVPDLK